MEKFFENLDFPFSSFVSFSLTRFAELSLIIFIYLCLDFRLRTAVFRAE